jgi:hypothetical protein
VGDTDDGDVELADDDEFVTGVVLAGVEDGEFELQAPTSMVAKTAEPRQITLPRSPLFSVTRPPQAPTGQSFQSPVVHLTSTRRPLRDCKVPMEGHHCRISEKREIFTCLGEYRGAERPAT